ncbi:NAD(P)-dependent oxidoreductase [Evansella tamaricis]|uniref:NAD(P)-dependent oxidoreductase n=1 Tax=Evansella tamaricis TaxID=2069301 RepID=A0ABS6JCF0_9BACI|nr:NAD(P)-dependent oxidoreductase [Evansella tamaricis]MBU9711183.1 NAD(P)-dependent oxidoreductase [Evansella tamaricis]
MTLKRVGFIGLGAMGLPMAKNLLKAGYELHISAHRNREPVKELKQGGATEHTSLGELAAKSEILISILPTDKEMDSVLLSEDILSHLSTKSILIEMTSGSPAMMKKVARAYEEKGIRVLDGPVSGGTAGAEQGTLTVMTGGRSEVLEDVRPVLNAMAKQIYLVGEIGAGKAIKAINQMLAAMHMVASAEAVALAEKLEIDKEMVKKVIGNSSGASWMLMNKIDSLSERNFTPGFKLALMKKDVQIANDEAGEMPLPFAANTLELFKDAEKEMGDLDFSAIGKNILP